MVEFSGASQKILFYAIFWEKIDGFRQKDSQGLQVELIQFNKQNPLENIY